MRVATYTRISTDEDHQPYSLEAQAHRLDAYVASQEGWSLTRSFTDQRSGATTDRPGLQRMLAEARAGRFDLLLVYRVDRFSRSLRGLATLLEELDAAGVAFRSATEPFDTTTPAGRMMVQMLGVFAEFERATIIDRVIAGMERKAARGEWAGGGRPFGYCIDSATGYLTAHPDEAPLVPVIFEAYAARKLGARAIASWLNERSHRTKAGRPWSHTAVLTVLRNRAYVGEVFFRDTHHPGPHPPLVERRLFDRVQALLAERGEDHAKRASNSSDYLLAGLIRCAHCGHRFVGNAATGNRYRYRYYTCFSRQRYGTTTCPAERLPAEELDAAVLDALLDTYGRYDLFERAVRAATDRAGALRAQHEEELAVTGAEIVKAETAIDRYLLAFESGTLPESQCVERVRSLVTKLDDLRRQREDATVALEAASTSPPTAEQLADVRAEIQAAIENGTTPTKKALLQALVQEITVEGRHAIQPVFRVPEPNESGDGDAKVRELSRLAPLIERLANPDFERSMIILSQFDPFD